MPATIRDMITNAWQQGEAPKSIATRLQRSTDFVYDTIKRFRETGSNEDRPHPGRPPLLSPALLKKIKSHVKGKRFHSLANTANWLRQEHQVSISLSSLWDAFRKMGLRSFKRPKVPKINQKQAQARVCWCKQHRLDDFAEWVWIDEKHFDFGHASNPQNDRVWAENPTQVPPREEEANPYQYRVIAGVCSKGLIGPFRYQGTLKSEEYAQLLEDRIIPAVRQLFGRRSWVLIHDRATCHTSKSTADKLKALGIAHMHLPAKSPDLNPVDNLFGIAAANLDEMNPQTVDEFCFMVPQAFELIPSKTYSEMVKDYQTRLDTVISICGRYPIKNKKSHVLSLSQ